MNENFTPCVYFLASGQEGYLYIGVTSDLKQRIYQHKAKVFSQSYTARHGIDRLVWYEQHGDMEHAILREKKLKRWPRAWKFSLVKEKNPNWDDLYGTL
jgi:putative endonuclease